MVFHKKNGCFSKERSTGGSSCSVDVGGIQLMKDPVDSLRFCSGNNPGVFYRCVLNVWVKEWCVESQCISERLPKVMGLYGTKVTSWSEKEWRESHSLAKWLGNPRFFDLFSTSHAGHERFLACGLFFAVRALGGSGVLGVEGIPGILNGTITIFAELSGRPRRTQLWDPWLSSPTGPTDHSSKISKSF